MKTFRILTLTTLALMGAAFTNAQTAEEIISKHLDAIGGKDQISKITSVYMEGTLDVMGNQGTIKITQLNSKGYKWDIDIMGTQVVMCYTDSMGWQINPMSGNYSAETMADEQFKAGKDQLLVGGPLLDCPANGYKVELVGEEALGSGNAYKLKVVSPDSVETDYYIDAQSYYLVRSVQKADMMGQQMEVITVYSKFEKTDAGYVLPYTIEMDYSGQFFMTTNIAKVDINVPVDPAIFAKP